MDAGISKLSLYDFLTMFLSGSLWLFILCPSGILEKECCCKSIISENNGLICLFLFIVAYLLGMIWNKVVECLCGLPNEKKCFRKFSTILSSFLRNNSKLIREAEQKVLSQPDKRDIFKYSDNDELRRYYFAYYYLQEKQSLGNIPILEAQEAFIRNFIIPLCTFLCVGIFCKGQLPYDILHPLTDLISDRIVPIVAVGIIILILLILLYLHYSIQMKIYELVWDCSYYISRLEEMRRLNLEMMDPCICDPSPSPSHNNVPICPFCQRYRRCRCPLC